jgi:hypothetical protein
MKPKFFQFQVLFTILLGTCFENITALRQSLTTPKSIQQAKSGIRQQILDRLTDLTTVAPILPSAQVQEMRTLMRTHSDIFNGLSLNRQVAAHVRLNNNLNQTYPQSTFERILASVAVGQIPPYHLQFLIRSGYDLLDLNENPHRDGLAAILDYGLLWIVVDSFGLDFRPLLTMQELAMELLRRFPVSMVNDFIEYFRSLHGRNYEQFANILEHERDQRYPPAKQVTSRTPKQSAKRS